MDHFYYNTYEKIITWKKSVYSIKAINKEEADEEMINQFNQNRLDYDCSNPDDKDLIPHWCEYDYEGDDYVITYQENRNRPSKELFDDEGNLLSDNTPLDIKRDKKIDTLLNDKDIPDFM